MEACMKIHLKKIESGLLACSEEDFLKTNKLKNGKVYRAEVKEVRNYNFLKKFFAMIDVVWENLPEKLEKGYGTKENFRYELTMRAGYRENWTTAKGAPMWRPKSISFAKMSEHDFQILYNSILDDVIQNFIKGLEKSVLEHEIASFL